MDERRINDLEARIAALEQRTMGDIRLGPRPETQTEIDARSQRLSEMVERIKTANDPVRMAKHEHEQDAEGRQICTTSGDAPSKVRAEQTEPTGQHKGYVVLCEDERKKGFVRPYRDKYKHVGRLERDNAASDAGVDEVYQRLGGCGSVTTMGRALSETYARDPKFYGATFCVTCNKHLPVSEFVWTADGQEVGS